MSWWINTKKIVDTSSAESGCGRIGCLIYHFERERFFFCCFCLCFFCTAWDWKNKKNESLLKMHGCGAIQLIELALIFLSLLLSSSTFSHTKSVIIAQDTRNTVTMLSLFLQKHDNYRKLSSIFFCHHWHHERLGEGGSFGGFGGTKTCHRLRRTGPENSWFWSRLL